MTPAARLIRAKTYQRTGDAGLTAGAAACRVRRFGSGDDAMRPAGQSACGTISSGTIRIRCSSSLC